MVWRVREFVPKCYAESCHVAFGLKYAISTTLGMGH
jgi:hypothetical protein